MELFEGNKVTSPHERSTRRPVGIAVNANIWRDFDYLWGPSLGVPRTGQRVRVPFGPSNKMTLGFVIDPDRSVSERKLKTVSEVIDKDPLLDERMFALGRWIARYYLTPLGMTLVAMIPSAVGKRAPAAETIAFLTSRPGQWGSTLGAKQKRMLAELLDAKKQGVEPLTIEALLRHSGGSMDSIKRLRNRNLIRLESRPIALPDLPEQQNEDPFELNEEQQKVLREVEGKLDGGFSCTLLHGVTGSGKTEVYIRAIRRVIESGRQGILMVPEIALATQTLQRLIRRIPRVVVLHSGLTDAQRALHYGQIREGIAAAVVGPRSAVFAPTRKLGLIIVDEEHEPTYKQDTAPRYHGRDVAIKRGSLESVPVLLGSATPSLESLHNAKVGRYQMLRLPFRVRSLPLPKLQIVNLRKEIRPGKIELIGGTLTTRMAAALDRREQIILLMNRRGYASYVFCPSCRWQLSCDNCTRLMVFHRPRGSAVCHYCDESVTVPERCPACGGKLVFFGYGIQRIETELAHKFPEARVARMDSDTMTSPKQFQKVLNDFAEGEVDILLGTQMVAKGLDFPRVSLVGVVSGDTSLAIPDFRSAERTFQLIVQVAGRAGRADLPGQVVVQTVLEGEPAIKLAAEQDYDGFAAYELPLRERTNLPPSSRMIRLIVRHRKIEKVERGAAHLATSLRRILPPDRVKLIGPQPAGVRKIRNLFRFQILLVFREAGSVQRLMYPRMEALCRDCPGEVITDVDPVNLM